MVDADGDVTLPGAFQDGAEVPVSAYGHTSWTGVLPVGRAVIRADHEKAWAEVRFLMTTQAGRETFEVVRDLGPLGQWSYGYDAIETDRGTAPDGSGRPVQFLRKLRVHEISPVLVGAGVNTTTESAKAAAQREHARYLALLPTTEQPDDTAARHIATREHIRFIRDRLTI